jgi:hypothetical protein
MRCAVAGALIGATMMGVFGWRGLWFTLVEIPGGLKWATHPLERLLQVYPVLALHVAAPAVVMFAARRPFRQSALLLPALVWGCTLPFGLAGLMKIGGWTNSIHSFVLWLPAVLTSFLAGGVPRPRRWFAALSAGGIAAALTAARIAKDPQLSLRPQVAAYEEARQMAAQFTGRIWFPVHPMVTLYSEHRYYHDEDGFYARLSAHKPTSPEQAAAQLPPALHLMAFRTDWSDWGIARRMLPPGSHSSTIGAWTLWNAGIQTSPH